MHRVLAVSSSGAGPQSPEGWILQTFPNILLPFPFAEILICPPGEDRARGRGGANVGQYACRRNRFIGVIFLQEVGVACVCPLCGSVVVFVDESFVCESFLCLLTSRDDHKVVRVRTSLQHNDGEGFAHIWARAMARVTPSGVRR